MLSIDEFQVHSIICLMLFEFKENIQLNTVHSYPRYISLMCTEGLLVGLRKNDTKTLLLAKHAMWQNENKCIHDAQGKFANHKAKNAL
jgi:hypothetical protein